MFWVLLVGLIVCMSDELLKSNERICMKYLSVVGLGGGGG